MAEETKLAHSDANAMEQDSPPSYHATTTNQSAVDMPEGLPPYGANGYNEPPPSYDSLFGRVKAAKASSSNNAQFAKSFLGILMGTLACTILLGILLAIPIAMTVIGSVYLHDCPAERYIPIYLLVAGVFGIVKNLSSLGQKIRNKKEEGEDDDQKHVKTNPGDMLLNCFLFAWFIAGNVWVYRTAKFFNTDVTSPQYCHPTCFYFAYWIITSVYIFGALIFVSIICAGIVACFTLGNVWVYRTYGNFSTNDTSPLYCHPTCYYFAFWIITSTYIFAGLVCFLTCCGGIVAAITTAK